MVLWAFADELLAYLVRSERRIRARFSASARVFCGASDERSAPSARNPSTSTASDPLRGPLHDGAGPVVAGFGVQQGVALVEVVVRLNVEDFLARACAVSP